jgi:hypothetical protein
MKRQILALLMVIAFAAPAAAQVSIPNTFTANTRIVSADVNANFTELGDKALNRTGGTATGDIVFATKLVPDADGGADIGTAALRFNVGYIEDLDVESGLIAGTIQTSDTGAASIDVAGGITAGTGNVTIVNTEGKIPELSSGFFASLSGASLTSIPETALTDGALLARLAANETITGDWTIQNNTPMLWFDDNNAAADNQLWRFVADATVFYLQTWNDALGASTDALRVTRSGSSVTNWRMEATSVDVVGRLNSASTQPGFLVTRTSGTPVTGAVDGDTLTWESEVYDTAGNFAAGVFTAPVTGTYQFCLQGSLLTTGSTAAGFKMVVNGVSYVFEADHAAANRYTNYGSCIYVPLTAAQTATAQVYENGSETVEYGYTARDVWFSGRLVP